MKQMKKYLFRLVAFLGLTITPFIASAEEVSLGESISKFLNDTGFARLVEGNWLCLVMIAVTFIGRILQMPITSDCWITSTSE